MIFYGCTYAECVVVSKLIAPFCSWFLFCGRCQNVPDAQRFHLLPDNMAKEDLRRVKSVASIYSGQIVLTGVGECTRDIRSNRGTHPSIIVYTHHCKSLFLTANSALYIK